jgi:hypothetical protein
MDRKLQVERFPADLRRKLRAEAALRGKTMREALIEAAQSWVDQSSSERTGKPS